MHIRVGIRFISEQAASFTHGFHNLRIGFPDVLIGKERQPRCIDTITHDWIQNILIS